MPELPILIPDLQISFYYRLREIENLYLGQSLGNTVKELDISILDVQLSELVSRYSLSKVSSFGMRGELFFPVPYLIESNPYLSGYYRLLYGLSQKDFYGKKAFARFKNLELKGLIPDSLLQYITPLCKSLIKTGEVLVDGIDSFSTSVIYGLQVITIGAQLRGSSLNKIGQEAVRKMYELIKAIVKPYIIESTKRSITIRNDSDRTVFIEFLADPDIRVQERLETSLRPIVAIEIKGGKDISNIYNRLGEANKSHQKAKNIGFNQFWTVVRVALDLDKAKAQSPLTNHFFNLDKIRDDSSGERRKFKELFCSLVGIKSPS